MNMSNRHDDPSNEWMKHQTDDFWDDWMRYKTFRFSESLVDALDEASAERKKNKQIEPPSGKEDQNALGVIAIALWAIVIVLFIISKSTGA